AQRNVVTGEAPQLPPPLPPFGLEMREAALHRLLDRLGLRRGRRFPVTPELLWEDLVDPQQEARDEKDNHGQQHTTTSFHGSLLQGVASSWASSARLRVFCNNPRQVVRRDSTRLGQILPASARERGGEHRLRYSPPRSLPPTGVPHFPSGFFACGSGITGRSTGDGCSLPWQIVCSAAT